MGALKDWLAGKKTYIVAIGAIVGAIVAWSQETMTDIQAIEAIIGAILAMTVRAGVAKS